MLNCARRSDQNGVLPSERRSRIGPQRDHSAWHGEWVKKVEQKLALPRPEDTWPPRRTVWCTCRGRLITISKHGRPSLQQIMMNCSFLEFCSSNGRCVCFNLNIIRWLREEVLEALPAFEFGGICYSFALFTLVTCSGFLLWLLAYFDCSLCSSTPVVSESGFWGLSSDVHAFRHNSEFQWRAQLHNSVNNQNFLVNVRLIVAEN